MVQNRTLRQRFTRSQQAPYPISPLKQTQRSISGFGEKEINIPIEYRKRMSRMRNTNGGVDLPRQMHRICRLTTSVRRHIAHLDFQATKGEDGFSSCEQKMLPPSVARTFEWRDSGVRLLVAVCNSLCFPGVFSDLALGSHVLWLAPMRKGS